MPSLGEQRTGDERAMRAVPVPSSTDSITYNLYVHRGKVVGCSCRWRKYHPREACKHMRAKQAELDQPSCLYCGRRTGGALLCGGCAW